MSYADFAKLAGVTNQTIHAHCLKKLKPACAGKRIDADHPAARKYLETRKKNQAGKAAPHTKRKRVREHQRTANFGEISNPPPTSADVGTFAHMTLHELISRFGTETAFVDWLKAAKMIEDVEEKRLKNAERRGELIAKDLVAKHILNAIESGNVLLLTDGAKTIAASVYGLSAAGEEVAAAEEQVSKIIGRFINKTISKIQSALKAASDG